jgi:predicted transcriptional regulator
METNKVSSKTVIGNAYNMVDEDSPIVVKDSNGNSMYIETLAVVVNREQPTLLIELAPF